jgi:hypothetical protein
MTTRSAPSGRARTCRALLAAVWLLAACASDAGEQDAGDRSALVDLVPAAVLERGLFLSGGLEEGFGSVLPAAALDLLGVSAGSVSGVAESGGVPYTALLIDVAVTDVVGAAAASGYDTAEVGDWTVLRRTPGGEGLQAAVPAAAVRDGALVVGAAEEVAALVDGAPPAAGVPWVAVVAGDPTVGAMALAPPAAALEAAAAAEGSDVATLLDRVGTRGALPSWVGWAAVRSDDGEGALVLSVGTGAADTAAARDLALRAATGPVAGSGRRAADVLTGGGPRVDADSGLLRLPVTWQVDAATLRRDVADGAYLFLAPDA